MNIKIILYIIMVPLSIWALDSLNIENKFKKNRYYQSRLLYLMISLSLSYLVVNFFYDFYVFTILKWRYRLIISVFSLNFLGLSSGML